MRQIDYIVIHCSATRATQNIGMREIKAWHTAAPPQGNGWADIGYHFVIRRDGRVENGRHIEEVGAHVRGYNEHSIGICMVGGVGPDGRRAQDNFTSEQWGALKTLVTGLAARFPKAKIRGHNNFTDKKACPSFDVLVWARAQKIKAN